MCARARLISLLVPVLTASNAIRRYAKISELCTSNELQCFVCLNNRGSESGPISLIYENLLMLAFFYWYGKSHKLFD